VQAVTGGTKAGGEVTTTSAGVQAVTGGTKAGGEVTTTSAGVQAVTGGVIVGGYVTGALPGPVETTGGVVVGGYVTGALPGPIETKGGVVVGGSVTFSSGIAVVVTGGTEIDGEISVLQMSYPVTATLWPDEATVVSGACDFDIPDTAQSYNQYAEFPSPAVGDSLSWSFFLAAGTYNLWILGLTGTIYGQTKIYVDGSAQSGIIDWYASPGAANVVLGLQIVVLTSGVHTLQIDVSGKNASSSNYYFLPSKLWIK